ncbi:hypothetical protein ACFL0S_07880, partial [Thermodesulfobacteriota bacterium]
MCRYTIHLVRYSLVLILSLSVWSATSLANVCSDGIALPPFLDAGADPNLLLVLDNSGSMLDAAYIDDTTQCVDTLFLKVRDEVDPTVINDDLSLIYAGNFERTDEAGDPIWYRWIPNPDGIEEWQTGECYGDGELLYAEGGFYQASCSLDSYNCPSDTDAPTVIDGCRESRSFFSERLSEANVYWESPAAPEWDASEPYVLGTGSATTFVKYDGLFYKLITANPPPSPPPADINPAIVGVQSHWELVDHTWQAGVSYPTDKIVSYNGMFYEQTVTSTSEEPGKLGNDDWKRLDEGFFAQVGSTIEQGSSTVTVQSCSAPTHSSSNSNDLRIEFLFDGSGTDVEDAIGVSCFEATGNLLNWAASSKFDIQKKILTGGKYFSGADPDEDGRLVMESRGCATKGFVKEIDLTDGATLTFRIAGPQKEQTIVSDDFRTRIDILAVTDSGGFNREYCDEVLRILSNPEYYDNNGDLEAKWKGELQDNTFGCLHGTTDPSEVEPPVANTEMHEFNRSVMDCWQIARGQKPSASGTLKTHCEKIYDGSDEPTTPQQYPWNIGPYDPWHICSGEYDPSGLTKGTGYVGRCWAESASSGGVDPDCNPLTCSESGTVLGQALGEGQYWHDSNWSNYWCDGGNILKCTNKKLVDCADADYSVYLTDTNGDECGGGPDPATRLCDDWDDDGSDDDLACWTDWELTGDGSEGLQSYIAAPVVPHEFNGTGGGTDRCVEYAEWDYCQSLSLDEIIDPSDQVFETGETFNIPASLIDAAVYQQLNVDVPLLSMAGYVKYDLPAVQISPGGEPAERPEGPRGVIYDVANDIRIGVMAFNDNGAATECAADDAGGNIVKHCPDGNRDGAKVIAKVDIGMSFDSSSLEDWDHYEDIIQAINDTQATSWTPLAEAVFNAIGYYGQNDEFRLDPEDFMTAAEAALVTPSDEELIDKWADPVQYWCQENHILIISEGASTADINPLVDTFVTANAEGLVFDDATDSGTDSTCADGLDGSTFLDDMTWFGQNATVTGNAANDSNLYDELLPKYPEDPTNTEHEKSTITTHIITTGTLRGELNGNECEPIEVMTQAADNGAAPTGLMTGEDPDQLEDNLRAVLQSILNRASAGSAASVISSSRSGEGAAYQAVFWPEIPRDNDDDPLVWTGDVHAMFIDELGQLWDDYSSGSGGNGYLYSEDTNGNGVIDPGEGTAPVTCLDGDRRIFYYYNATENRTEICFNTSGQETGTCDPAQTVYCGAPFGEPYTIREFQDYVWSAKDELTGIADGDVIINRVVNPPTAAAGLHPSTLGLWSWDGVTKRYLFTWNDL